jgi:hypothetical protein
MRSQLSIAKGVRATAGAASSVTAIPDDSAGVKAKVVAVRALTASEVAVVLPVIDSIGAGSLVTASNGIPVSKEQPLILNVSGYEYLATIRFGSADVALNITPVENY